MNISSNMPTNTAEVESNEVTVSNSEPFGILVRRWLVKHLPAKVQLGVPSLDPHLENWEPGASYVVAGKHTTATGSMALTLAENFATGGGHLIWIGTTDDLHRMYEQLMFKNAGLVLAAAGSTVPLDAVAQFKLKYAHEQIGKMWIDFCNVEECGNADVEQEFLASVASFKPTLIVVDESIFDETTLNPFEILVRQTHALHMVKELRSTNPMSSVLWHLPMEAAVDDGVTEQRPTLNDLASAASSIKPDVVMLVYACDELKSQHNAEVIVAANAFGSTGIVPMAFDKIHRTWHELENSARAD